MIGRSAQSDIRFTVFRTMSEGEQVEASSADSTAEPADTELINAFVAAYNVLKEGTIFGPKSATYLKAKS